jgi:predicted small metal-binding protein
MAKVLRCKHIGPDSSCSFEARGQTTDDILKQVAEHAGSAHGIKEVTPELVEKAQANMSDE